MIRIGIIGAGPNGQGNAKKISLHTERCRVTAIADLNLEAAQKMAETYGAKAVQNFEDFLGDVDAVIISSPNWLHPEQAVALAKAGKHIWIEKPMALNVADADRICQAVDEAGVASFVGFSVRFANIPRTLKQRYLDGDIGALRSIWSRRLCNLFANGKTTWRQAFKSSGGVMSELIAHEIDWLIDIAGKPETVYCRIQSNLKDDPKANDHVWLTFTFANGSTGTIEGAQNAKIADYYKGIVGDLGSVSDRNWGGEAYLNNADGDRKIDPIPAFDKHENFLDAIEGRAESVASAHWGRDVVYLTERALESAINNTVVKLEWKV